MTIEEINKQREYHIKQRDLHQQAITSLYQEMRKKNTPSIEELLRAGKWTLHDDEYNHCTATYSRYSLVRYYGEKEKLYLEMNGNLVQITKDIWMQREYG